MTTTYVDTSAAAKLLVEESESDALAEYLDGLVDDGTRVWSSLLLETELRRLALRAEIPQRMVSDLLTRFDLIEPSRTVFHQAGVLLPDTGRRLRSLDALHLAAAEQVAADVIVAYDQRLAEAADNLGIRVVAPPLMM